MNRRQVLWNGIRLVAGAAFSKSIPSLVAQDPRSAVTPLKTAGACSGRQIGIAADKAMLQDPSSAQIVVRNFNLLTVSGMKWNRIHPGPDTYDFTEADWNMHFAEQNGMNVHGHNLCWNSPLAYPTWFKSVLTSSNAKQFLTEHIATVVKRYAGRIASWDVVNEPVVPWSRRSGGLYPGVWTDLLGPSYIDTAFHAVAAADPKALRVLNIYRVEQGTDEDEKTRRDTIALLKQLLARGVPVQAVGIESHLDVSQPLGEASFHQFLTDIRALKLQILITELDAMENRAVGDSPTWDETAARYYGDYLTEVLSTANPAVVIFWSLKDRWESGRRIQGLMQENLSPRVTYRASVKALEKGTSCE
jgi:endo-1,4-beta-xylanase